MLLFVFSLLSLWSGEISSIPVATPVRHNWTRTEIMDQNGLYILEWHLENKDIIFTATVNTRGFIGLGFSYKHNRMTNADLVLAWVDDRTGKPNILVSIIMLLYFQHFSLFPLEML
jgi:hypothetical protein